MIKLQSGDYDFVVICDRVSPHFATLMWQNEQSLPHNRRTLAKSLVKPQKNHYLCVRKRNCVLYPLIEIPFMYVSVSKQIKQENRNRQITE